MPPPSPATITWCFPVLLPEQLQLQAEGYLWALSVFRLLAHFSMFSAGFWCLLVVSSTSMAPFVFMSSSINPCLHNHTHTHTPVLLVLLQLLYSNSHSASSMSKRRFIIFGQRRRPNAMQGQQKEIK